MSLEFNLLDYYKSSKDNFSVREHEGLYKVVPRHLGIDWEAYQALESRGIVLDSTGEVVQRPFKKFFNYKQFTEESDQFSDLASYCEWDYDSDFYVTEKIDGSFVIVSTYLSKLLVSSSGNLTEEYAIRFKKWFETNLSQEQMDYLIALGEVYTLMFEYTSPQTKIVIEYPEEAMTLIGIRNTRTGKLLPYSSLKGVSNLSGISSLLGIPLVKRLEIETLAELKYHLKHTKGIEGFVVNFYSGHMLKFKTEEYIKLHGEVTPWLFSRGDTRRVVSKIISCILDETLDDVMSMPALQGRLVIDSMNTVLALYRDFISLYASANKIAHSSNFDRKTFYTTETDSTMKHLVSLQLHEYAKPEEEEKALRNYIHTEFEKIKIEERGF